MIFFKPSNDLGPYSGTKIMKYFRGDRFQFKEIFKSSKGYLLTPLEAKQTAEWILRIVEEYD